MSLSAISIIEATSRDINVDVLSSDGSKMNLTGYKSFISLVCDGKLVTRRECTIYNNTIFTRIFPKDTLNRAGHDMRYEIRVVDEENGVVLAVQSGKIKISASIDAIITENPDLIDDIDCGRS